MKNSRTPDLAMPDDGEIVEISRGSDVSRAVRLGDKWFVERSHGGPYQMGDPTSPDLWRPIQKQIPSQDGIESETAQCVVRSIDSPESGAAQGSTDNTGSGLEADFSLQAATKVRSACKAGLTGTAAHPDLFESYHLPEYPDACFPHRCKHAPEFHMGFGQQVEMDHMICIACGSALPCTNGGNILVDCTMILGGETAARHSHIYMRVQQIRDKWSKIATYLFDEHGWNGRHERIARLIDPKLTMKLTLEPISGSTTRMGTITFDPDYLNKTLDDVKDMATWPEEIRKAHGVFGRRRRYSTSRHSLSLEINSADERVPA